MSILFDNTDDEISFGTCADAVMTENGALTISMWFKQTAGDVGKLIVRGNSSNDRVVLETKATQALQFTVQGLTTLNRLTNTGMFSDGAWTHVLLTWDGSTTAANVHIYIGNIGNSWVLTECSYATTTNGATVFDNSAYAVVVGDRNVGSGFGGSIAEVALWSSVLSGANITSLSTDQAHTRNVPINIGVTPKLYATISDKSDGTTANGGTVADTSGTGNNGTGSWGANASGLTWNSDTDLWTVIPRLFFQLLEV